MSWELLIALGLVTVIVIYAAKHLPKALEQLKKELGE